MNLTTIIVTIIGLLILLGLIGHIQLTFTLNSWINQIQAKQLNKMYKAGL